MELPELTVVRAGARDLSQITAVIASAIDAWPAPPRLKRNVLPILAYDEQDLTDHEILLLKDLDRPVAVGAWQTNRHLPDPHCRTSTLLHGLFVARGAQTRGLGRWLQASIAQRALAAGFHGLHVKAERFARAYFVRCGYRHLASDERPGNADAAYPHWFWQECTSIVERCGEVAVAGLMRQPNSSAREVIKREGVKT